MTQWIKRQLARTDIPVGFFVIGFLFTVAANAVLIPWVNEIFAQRERWHDIKIQEVRDFSAKALAFDISLLEMLSPMLKGPLGSDNVPEEARILVLSNISSQIGALDVMKKWLPREDVITAEKYQAALTQLHKKLLDINDFMGLRNMYPILDEIAELREKIVGRLRQEAGLPT